MASVNRHRFSEFPELSTDRLLLRRVVPRDAADIVEISRYDGWAAASTEDALKILDLIESDYTRGESLHWGVCLRPDPGSDGEVVGTCGFYRGYPDNIGEIGYVLRSGYRGQGIMTEAARLAVNFALSRMGLNAVIARTDPANHGSIRVLERLGFERVLDEATEVVFRRSAMIACSAEENTHG